MEWMLDPSAWVGLLTLVILEIVLGIDNLTSCHRRCVTVRVSPACPWPW
jgi:hypothetical protein